ncbi:NAC domain containing protein [Parasponia andersonii]|uniref:NAC domain containing protein n=1 Tax=Parasponia andersonii TaxID=3476 RepID=A0A2P5D6M5_PARAD|nr:NAC domain containing protein [Parasponia andersonii]
MYNFEVDRKHSGENYFTREAGNGFWKFHSFEPVTMGERAATVRHVKHTEGPIMGPFSTTTLRYYRLMIKHHHIQFGSYTRDAVRDLLKGLVQGKHIIGYKTRLVYYEGQAKCGTKTNWVMDEYRVNENYLPKSKKITNSVLCKIYQNDQKKEEESTSDNFPKPFAEVFARLYSPKLPIDLFSKF